jgi:hypothetical protein
LAPPKPREALLSTLERIWPFIGDREFKLLKSGPALKKRWGDFTFLIAFNGSRWNVSGDYVRFQMVAIVECKSLQAWRQSQTVPVRAMWQGRQSARVTAKAFNDQTGDYWSWDLGGQDPDRGTVARLLNTISKECLPWFDLCIEPASFAKLGLPADRWSDFIELALSRNDRPLACEIATAAIRGLPSEKRTALRTLLERSTIDDYPAVMSSALQPLAGVIVVNNLEVSFPD